MSSSNATYAVSTNSPIKKVLEMNNREYYFDQFLVGRPEDDVAVIIDGANLSYMTRKVLQAKLDYKVLSHIFYANFPGVRNISYIIAEFITQNYDKDDSNNWQFRHGYSPLRGLILWLKNNRYKVISRKVLKDSANVNYVEASMDVEITTALYKAARFANHIVFIGSSAKFIAPLQDLHEQGKTITVIGIKKPETIKESPHTFYTAEGLREIDNFVDLHDPFFNIMFKDRFTSVATPRVTSEDNNRHYHREDEEDSEYLIEGGNNDDESGEDFENEREAF